MRYKDEQGNIHYGPLPYNHRCLICDATFRSMELAQKHFWKEHKDKAIISNELEKLV